jgi:hypothetical protein
MTDEVLVEEARTKRIAPAVSREKGQRSLQVNSPFFVRYLPQWRQPDWLGAEKWRAFVQAQPFAVDCREAIINYVLSLDWKIVPRDSTKMDELKPVIDYYTSFLEHTGEYEFADIVEWLLKDYLDLPFGGCAELGREGDNPNGRVRWIKLLDGGTLFPTHNTTYPIGQALPSDTQKPVYFPAHAVDRLYMSPRTEFIRYGWGMAPPEKIYLAIDLMTRGDKYYVNLLSDTPEAGLLDLMNMSKTSAEEWIEAFKAYMAGVDPFKIPVLYEHEQAAQWIPFGRPPTELMYDRTITKYAAITCGGYGVTFSDIGFPGASSGGDTLAGSIRQERTSKRSGKSKAKRRLASWFNNLIDPTREILKFEWIDLDDEVAVAMGRARLANSTAMGQFIDKGIISPQEARLQTIADGTFTISIPEEIPPEAQERIDAMNSPERPGMLGKPVSPSQGGHGEVLPRSKFDERLYKLYSIDDLKLKRLANAALPKISVGVNKALDELEISEMGMWADWQQKIIWGDILEDIPELTETVLSTSIESLDGIMKLDPWWEVFSDTDDIVDEILEMIRSCRAEEIYVAGESVDIDDYKLPKKQYNSLHKELSKDLAKLNVSMKQRTQKAVLAGMTIYLSSFTQKLDETLKIDDNLIKEIRFQLISLSNRILNEFGKNLEKLMEN